MKMSHLMSKNQHYTCLAFRTCSNKYIPCMTDHAMTDPLLENGSQVQQVAMSQQRSRRCSNPQKWGFARKALKVSKGSFWWHTKITDKPIIWNNHITWYSCYILKTTWRPCLLLVALLQMSHLRWFLSSWWRSHPGDSLIGCPKRFFPYSRGSNQHRSRDSTGTPWVRCCFVWKCPHPKNSFLPEDWT